MPGTSDETESKRFATVVLPKWIAGGAFLVYVLTLNRWFSLDSLALFARAAGWSWYSEPGQPLTRALLFPFRILPTTWIPIALNLFNAACAALVVGLLARTVAILPQDLLPLQPFRKKQPLEILSTSIAWMPPVLAAIVCGLQLSFWENATSMTGQMIDMLVFAWIVRCLFEFRHDRNEKRLVAAALAFGAGMANNWLMLAYFPVFVLGLLGVKGWKILEPRFMRRMCLYGLIGLSLYLLVPLVQVLFTHADVSFWGLLKAHVRAQRDALSLLQRPLLRLIAFTGLLPFVLLATRWRSHTVDAEEDVPLGVVLLRASGHAVHIIFFVCALWVALDPDFAPRTVLPGLPTLTWYYACALAFGYCVGYVLLFHHHRPKSLAGKISVTAVRFAVVIVPALLLWRNLSDIRGANSPALHEFARQLYSDLPAGKSAVLSDDPVHLLLLRAETAAHRGEKDPMLLETDLLALPQYEASMSRQFPSRWPEDTRAVEVSEPKWNDAKLHDVPGRVRTLRIISSVAAREPVLYADAAFGFCFEKFADEPHGFTHVLQVRPAEEPVTPVISQPTATGGEALWQSRWNTLQRFPIHPPRAAARSELHDLLRLSPRFNFTVSLLNATYSKAFDDWGVRVQRLGRATESAVWFERALTLNPWSFAAKINLEYNQAVRRGDKSRLKAVIVEQQWADVFARYKTWREVMISNGPVDEPTYLFRTGRMFLQNGNSRQAASAFARSMELAPEWLPPKLFLAETCLGLGNLETALRLAEQLEPAIASAPTPGNAAVSTAQPFAGSAGVSPAQSPASATNGIPAGDASPFPQETAQTFSPARFLLCRATALLGLGRTNEMVACIESYVGRYKENSGVLTAAVDLYGKADAYDLQLKLLNNLLEREPNQPKFLALQGYAELQLTNYPAAIEAFTKVVQLSPEDQPARLSRAGVYLAADNLEPARADYQFVLNKDSNCADALFGLATIAWREHDTNQASRLYAEYLAQGKPRSAQYLLAADRLKQLRP